MLKENWIYEAREKDEDVCTIALVGDYVPRYVLMRHGSTDLGGAIEETLHRILDASGDDDDVYYWLGAVPEELVADKEDEESVHYIDLGYVLPGQILSSTPLPMTERLAVIKDDYVRDTQIFCSKVPISETDPEDRALSFDWFDVNVPLFAGVVRGYSEDDIRRRVAEYYDLNMDAVALYELDKLSAMSIRM